MFATALFLRSRRAQRPSNHSDLDSTVGRRKRLLDEGGTTYLFFVPQYVIVVALRLKWYIMHNAKFLEL